MPPPPRKKARRQSSPLPSLGPNDQPGSEEASTLSSSYAPQKKRRRAQKKRQDPVAQEAPSPAPPTQEHGYNTRHSLKKRLLALSPVEKTRLEQLCKSSFKAPPQESDAFTILLSNVQAVRLASRYHEDGVNVDPGAFEGDEESRANAQLEAIKNALQKFDYAPFILDLVNDPSHPFFQEIEKWKSAEAQAKRQAIASNRREMQILRNREHSRERLLKKILRRGVEVLRAEPECLKASELRVTSTGWQGINVNRLEEGAAIRDLYNNDPNKLFEVLRTFHRVPYAEKVSEARITIITDSEGLALIVRSVVVRWMLQDDGLKALEADTLRFVVRCKFPFMEEEMRANARGPHFFSIIGLDRNSKKLGEFSVFHRKNLEAIEWFFREDGPMRRFDAAVAVFVKTHFPLICKRIRKAAEKLKLMFGEHVKPMYGRALGEEEGLFYNFCANAPRPFENIPRVQCAPHVDHKNLAICVCVILIYGHFNHKERCWLVIWEAGLIIELPPGVMLAYPSSLFFHWNVDVCELDKAEFLVTKDGSRPDRAKGNAEPLVPEDPAERWKTAYGRGSMVWFNQATLFQSAELGVNSVKTAASRGMDTTCDHQALIRSGYFPKAAGQKTPEAGAAGSSDGPNKSLPSLPADFEEVRGLSDLSDMEQSDEELSDMVRSEDDEGGSSKPLIRVFGGLGLGGEGAVDMDLSSD